MKKSFLMILLLFPLLMNGQNLAYVYADSILQSVPDYGKNMVKVDSIRQAMKNELESSQASLQQKYDKLIKPYVAKETESLAALKKRMTPVDTLSLNLIVGEDKQLQTKKQTYDRILQTTFNKDIQPVLDKVNNLISNYARENKITMVLVVEQMRPALAYIDPKQNITKVIIRKLKEKK
jgi:Skp family chaperone for outer membrane proteins